MSLILTRPGCPGTSGDPKFCLDLTLTDGTDEPIQLFDTVFLLVELTTSILNLVSAITPINGFIPHDETDGTPNNIPIKLCNC